MSKALHYPRYMAAFLKKHMSTLIVISIFALVAFFHIWQLDTFPRELFIDEASNGLNALTISETGHDEHGNFLPLFIRSFGGHKGSVQHYITVFVFWFFWPSPFMLLFSSTVSFFLFLLGAVLLIQKLSPKNTFWVLTYTLLASGMLPWFFPISRTAFEVNAMLPVMMFAVYWIFRTFEQPGKQPVYAAAIAGTLTSLTIFTYQAGKLLGPLLAISVILLYARPSRWKNCVAYVGACAALLIPYIFYTIEHPAANTARLQQISYVLSEIPLSQKIAIFISNYFKHFSFDFLLLSGDANLRHAIQYGGELLVIVWFLALLGIGSILFLRNSLYPRFRIFLLINLFLAPIPASLTLPYELPHAMRSIAMGIFFVLLSCIGYLVLQHLFKHKTTVVWTVVLVILFLETNCYAYNYFWRYPEQKGFSAAWWEYGAEEALRMALERHPGKILFAGSYFANGFNYANYEFYRRTIPREDDPPVARIDLASATATDVLNTCVIARPAEKRRIEELAPSVDLTQNRWRIRLHCFE